MAKKYNGVSELASRGGMARAELLSPEERREIAQKAASARWDTDVPEVAHEGEFNLGNLVISAAVLPNGKRLLTQATFLRAIGRSRSPKGGTGVLATVDGIPFFLQAEVLKSFISEDLMMSTTPIFFRDGTGKRSVGYDAELLPMVADVYLKFRDACIADSKPIPRQYQHIVKACDLITRGLARVGIVALVDEATGFQEYRAKNALARFLEAFIAKELRQWVKTFPADFYKEMFRLRGLEWPTKKNPPQYVGHLTNDLIYARLAPGVLEELKKKNPTTETGHRKSSHHQWLTAQIGHPKLLHHLGRVTGLMQISEDWESFKVLLDKHVPKYQDMPLFKGLEDED